LQCFYPIPLSEDGVQTNWLKKDKKGENPDWSSYPNGADFGLSKGRRRSFIQNLVKAFDF
jgi:hypothetical protein